MAAVVPALDQATKAAVTVTLEGRGAVVIVPHLVQFIYRTNTGAGFSTFQDHPGALRLFSSLVAFGLACWGWRLKTGELHLRGPIGMILGGAVGNLIDRYRVGSVTDFIDAHWDNVYHFPTFNVADSAIAIGMTLMMGMSLWAVRDAQEKSGKCLEESAVDP